MKKIFNNYNFLLNSKYSSYEEIKSTQSEIIAVGDLHASCRKLMEFLYLFNVITDDVAISNFIHKYDEAWAVWESGDTEKFISLHQEIEHIIDDIQIININKKLLFLGDTIVDRGLSDALIMKMFKRLRDIYNDNCIVILSNHDWGFVTSREMYDLETPMNISKNKSYERAIVAYGDNYEVLEKMYYNHLKNQKLLYRLKNTLFTHTLNSNEQSEEAVGWGGLLTSLEKVGMYNQISVDLTMEKFNKKYVELLDHLLKGNISDADKSLIQTIDQFCWYVNKDHEDNFNPIFSKEIETIVHGHYYYKNLKNSLSNNIGQKTINLNNVFYQDHLDKSSDVTAEKDYETVYPVAMI